MSKKPPRLLDLVKAAVAARPKRPQNWFDRLSAESQEELLAIKSEWKQGLIESSAKELAADLIAMCGQLGIKTCGPDGMRAWLSKD